MWQTGILCKRKAMENTCPCCFWSTIKEFGNISGYEYYQCDMCNAIFIDPDTMNEIDNGKNIVRYSEEYWKFELKSSKKRSYGEALARMSEVFFYTRRPITVFLDIGTGPGFFLDAVEMHLPGSKNVFWGVEKYPPDPNYRTKSNQYFIGDVGEFPFKADAGMCIEVIEHMTPKMLREMFLNLAKISNLDACYIFNSGMPDFVVNENPSYLDPVKRGHIASYSIEAIRHLCQPYGFSVFTLPGKTWAFIVEYKSSAPSNFATVTDRIWRTLPENLDILEDNCRGGGAEDSWNGVCQSL
jgi:hypothetical protein